MPELTYCDQIGLNECYERSLVEIDGWKCDDEIKRNAMYSLLCFRSLFDNVKIQTPSHYLTKYNCLSAPEPKKFDLIDLVYDIVKGANTRLRALWYVCFPVLILIETPFTPCQIDLLKKELCYDEVFSAVIKLTYSKLIPDSEREMAELGYPSVLIEWYEPYLDYEFTRDDNGVMRCVTACKNLLASGEFDECLLRAEKLLATFPDDIELLLCDVAARVSFGGVTSKESRQKLMQETLELADEGISVSHGKHKLYFTYYKGLTLLGLGDEKGCRQQMNECLANDENFELAKFILKGLDGKIK